MISSYLPHRSATADTVAPPHRSATADTVAPIFAILFLIYNCKDCEPGSSVGTATDYGLGGPGIESRWGSRFSAPVQTGRGANPASCTMGTVSFAGVNSGRGVLLTTHPLPASRSWKSRAIPLLPSGPQPGL